ncbi:MscS Mechanosensitive ion channel [Desulforamulus reducens MI-1]|uniref:MscS Mechanosensitive ion channel n=1 Tax=Desulforamulus reducens (strain ATCC BAA-1160 / DSM 100696 / MI-1) TaxID=349161 RepID=A4J9Q7_DESRM|nr:mechanosensitive ion channel family protein [Desulforamulus reducens]ABO51810.1 MscS Mechanosensitive ion channel [Desulforamulus reducens MI-1]
MELNDLKEWMLGLYTINDIQRAISNTFRIIATLILARFTIYFGSKVIEKLFIAKPGKFFSDNRAQTLAGLLKSALRYIVYFVAAMSIIEIFIPNAAKTILAGAGILGLAVGFGAQNLVRDIITGFFILFEDQYAVGEYVTVAGVTGTVEEIGMRVTKIREVGGQLHIIPNGIIDQVANYNRGGMLSLVEIGISYEENVDRAIEVLKVMSEEFAKTWAEVLIEGPNVLGVVRFGESDVVIRITAKTKPMYQWEIERQLRKRIKEVFDQEGIEIPYPRRVLITTGGGADNA